jgi:hypothetical protein
VGVGQPLACATAFRLTVALLPSGRRPVVDASLAICDPVALPTVGVGQPLRATVLRLESLLPASLFPFCAGVPAIGVGQPNRSKEGSLSDVRRPDARSRYI